MIKITLPDGSIRTYQNGITAMEVAKDISIINYTQYIILVSFIPYI